MREPRVEQRQDSLLSQLQSVIDLANQHGCYDAADWVKDRLSESLRRQSQKETT